MPLLPLLLLPLPLPPLPLLLLLLLLLLLPLPRGVGVEKGVLRASVSWRREPPAEFNEHEPLFCCSAEVSCG